MNKERFEKLYHTLPWNVEPEDKQDYDEVQRITKIAIAEKMKELLAQYGR